jgi:type 2A phosphatase activator TIP41
MLFGYNRLYLINKQKDFLYAFSPLDALRLCQYSEQQKHLLSNILAEEVAEGEAPASSDSSEQERLLNSISMQPKPIEVKESKIWKQKDLSSIKDLTTLEAKLDWSFSTPYKGTIKPLRQSSEQLQSEVEMDTETIQTSGDTTFSASLDHLSKEELPLHMLGADNPIKHYGEVVLFEDELGDKGFSKLNVRFRIMDDCFLVLLRSYVRVDHVLVRILDTRIFHQFGKDYLIRDFQHKESTYNQLRTKGFKFGSEWSLSPHQSDEIYVYLDDRLEVTDKVMLS